MDSPPNPAVANWTSVLAYAPRYLEHRRAFDRQPGYQVAIAVDGTVLGAFSGGYADIAAGTALQNSHLFRIASHSKMFTATAIMQLAEAGRLTLEDPVAVHLPVLAGTDAGECTVGELLSHSAGLTRDGEDADFWVLGRSFPDRAGLLGIAARARVIERQQRFKYTNVGYGLLGLVIGAASRQDYRSYMRSNVIEPLGLPDTGPDLDGRAARLATGYGALAVAGEPYTLERRTVIEHVDTGAMDAATGFYSTARDMVRFLSAHLLPAPEDQSPGWPAPDAGGPATEADGPSSGGPASGPTAAGSAAPSALLGRHSLRRMQRRMEDTGAPGVDYGLGMILQDVHGHRTLGHSGGYPGHITRSWALPDSGVALSVLTNAVDGPAAAWGEALIALATLADKEAPASYSRMQPADLARFTGRFAGLWGVQDIVELGGKLYQLPLGAAPDPDVVVPLDIVDAATLRSHDPNGFGGYGEDLAFEFDDAGAAALRGPGGVRIIRQSDVVPPARLAAPARLRAPTR